MTRGNRVDVVVLGAGVMGLVAAVTLNRAGLRVMLCERAGDLTSSAGFRAGGMVAPDCEAETAEPLVVALGRRSLPLWPALSESFVSRGTLVVAPLREPAALVRFEKLTANHAPLSGPDIDAIEPTLAGRFRRGLFFPDEGHLDPRRTLTALKDELCAKGVSLIFGFCDDPEKLEARFIVDARGMGARDRFPNLRGVKGEMALIRSRDITLERPVRLLHHRHPLYVVPRRDGVFMIGATTIESDAPPNTQNDTQNDTQNNAPEQETRVSLRSAGELLTQAYALHPAFGDAEIVEFNAGYRPAFPDHRPRIELSGRTIAVNGLYRHGFLIAPALALRILSLIREHERATIPPNEVIHADLAQW